MPRREMPRWYLRRLYHPQFAIVNIGRNTDISRSPRSAIYLQRASFQHISKQHCTISCKDGVATLTDKMSTTGTYVNARRLSRERPGSIVLSKGDLIGFGTSCFMNKRFYKENSSVLLFKVCKHRDRVVDVIVLDDDEDDDEPEGIHSVEILFKHWKWQ